MSSRKSGYLLGLLLLAVLCCFPHGLVLWHIIAEDRYYEFMPDYVLGELCRVQRGEDQFSGVWQDRMTTYSYYNPTNGNSPFNLEQIDPRTGERTSLKGEVPGTRGAYALVFGTRLWMVGTNSGVELVDGKFQPSSMVHPNLYREEQQQFLLDGQPAILVNKAPVFSIMAFNGKAWTRSYDLVLPDTGAIDGVTINFKKASHVACLNQGNRLHLFLDVEGRMLHHEGLRLRVVPAPTTANGTAVEIPVSALSPENITGDINGWTIVNKTPMVRRTISSSYREFPNHLGLLVDGNLATIVLDTSDAQAIVGHLFRLEDGKWSEFATQTFPLGTAMIHAAISRNQQTSFVLATTSAGLLHVYEVDAAGIHVVPRSQTVRFQQFIAVHYMVWWVTILVIALELGAVNGLGITILMWWYTRPDYGFGLQQVKLAGIGWRALARLIDLGLIVVSTVMLVWWLTRGFDWLTLIEVLNLQTPHPILQSMMRIGSTLVLWLVACEGLMVVTQARWGLTPGKWCCGLRVLQTTLRPCGLARSLCRELVLYVDVCGFLCWTPGITSIALTDHRQRLGDLVGGTIVVRASSMKVRNVG